MIGSWGGPGGYTSPLGGPERDLTSTYPMDDSPTATALSTKGDVSDQCAMSRSILEKWMGRGW
jgi:hypothetical protein